MSQLVTSALRYYLPAIHTPDDRMEDIKAAGALGHQQIRWRDI